MLFISGLFLTLGVTAISTITFTASDLPECAVECYCYTGEKVKIPVTDYEGQCRSAPFQIALRECAEKVCNEEEFSFVNVHRNLTHDRQNTTQGNTVPNLELTSIMFSRIIHNMQGLQ
jgi:CFEM domain